MVALPAAEELRRQSFSIDAEQAGSVRTLRLGGTVAVTASHHLAELLSRTDREDVVVDLTECRLLDCSALQVLVDFAQSIRMTVICPPGCLGGMLRFVGLADLARIEIVEPTN
jgi:anti-anti-sigma factor